MSTMHHVAQAALPVAVVLVVLAGIARACLSGHVADARARRLAGAHLDPLSTWALGATAVYGVAVVAAGELAVVPVVIAVGLLATAYVLSETAPDAQDANAAGAMEVRTAQPTPPAPPQRLWVDPAEEAATRTGLWSRG